MTEPLGLPPNLRSGVNVYQAIPIAIAFAFQELLNTKHLYQHVDISVDRIREQLSTLPYFIPGSPIATILDQAVGSLNHYWMPRLEAGKDASRLPHGTTIFDPPTVKTFCEQCESVQPFNYEAPDGLPLFQVAGDEQIFALGYLCQGCREFWVSFMVTRVGLRLTLSGRSVIERVQVPPYIPKGIARYYSSAVYAHNCNETLPALFMLRTLIEQHMHVTVGRGKYNDADKLCEAYNDTLDATFKDRYPSIPAIYSRLSEALHEAREDDELFVSQRTEIEKHLRAKKSWDEDHRASD